MLCMGEANKEELCQHLDPKEVYIENNGTKKWENHEIPWNSCRIKQAMGLEKINCAFVSWTNDHGLEYVNYDTDHAQSCPLYTKNMEVAERVRLMIVNARDSKTSFFI